jgi:hypothetical protein
MTFIEKLIAAWRYRCAVQHKMDLENMLSGLIDARHHLADEIEHTAELLVVANHHVDQLERQHTAHNAEWKPT